VRRPPIRFALALFDRRPWLAVLIFSLNIIPLSAHIRASWPPAHPLGDIGFCSCRRSMGTGSGKHKSMGLLLLWRGAPCSNGSGLHTRFVLPHNVWIRMMIVRGRIDQSVLASKGKLRPRIAEGGGRSPVIGPFESCLLAWKPCVLLRFPFCVFAPLASSIPWTLRSSAHFSPQNALFWSPSLCHFKCTDSLQTDLPFAPPLLWPSCSCLARSAPLFHRTPCPSLACK